MNKKQVPKFKSVLEIYEFLPDAERLLLDVLRQIVIENLPSYCREKIAYNVPYFYGNKGICIIWPASIPRGGVGEGVLLGFWNGHLLSDEDDYLTRGTNKKVFYKIYTSVEEIEEEAIVKLINEALALDSSFAG